MLFAGLAFTTALFSNAQKTEEREVESFNSIRCRGALEVIYTHSDTLKVYVEARASEIDRVETKTNNGVLTISNKGNFDDKVLVRVYHNNLDGVQADGATKFSNRSLLKADKFETSVSGAAMVTLNIEANEIQSEMSGAAQLKLKGKTERLRVKASGASNLKAYGLQANDVDIESSGASNAEVTALTRFNGSAAGASSIKLKGEPADVNAESGSAASITRVKPKNENAGKDTLTYHLNKKKVIIIDESTEEDEKKPGKNKGLGDAGDFKHWRGVSLGVNGYLTPSGSMEMPAAYDYMDLNYARSFNFQINPVERHFNIVRHNFKLVTGLGFDFHRYELAKKVTLNASGDYTDARVDSSGLFSYHKNKLRTTYLQVPLLFEFNTSNNYKKTFHLAFGVIGQYLIGSSTKQRLSQEGNDIKILNKDDFNLNPFAVKAHVNLGYRGWTIFAEYALTPLFKTSKGPELYPIAAGLRVIPFT